VIELIQMFIAKPSNGLLAILSACVVYTGIGLFDTREAIAGMEQQLSTAVVTEQRVYAIHNAIGRIEIQLSSLQRHNETKSN
tara:strand:- start:5856 stop:6101 length:246 start_codon:yes stop_codon:yes gene_type:complete